jgi:hypothetical protein
MNCPTEATHWVEWPTTGRPKGAFVCDEHLGDTDRLTVVRPVTPEDERP